MSDAVPAPEWTKTVLRVGEGDMPDYEKNTKAVFNFRTLKLRPDLTLDEESAEVVDDSRTSGLGPFELLCGREFTLSVWEEAVREMKVGELSRFHCPFKLVMEYPRVSKALRDLAAKRAGHPVPHQHHCGFGSFKGTGQADLDKVTEEKSPLAFEIELLRVFKPGNYKREAWAMSHGEKTSLVPQLRDDGNTLYKQGKHREAAEKYFEAIGYLEELGMKEKPHEHAWNEIEREKVPLLLNYSQCQLLMGKYAEVIRHTTTVLDFQKDSVKALYRRGRAHAACWNVKEAKADLEEAVRLDPTLSRTVEKELTTLTDRVKEKDLADRKQYAGKLF